MSNEKYKMMTFYDEKNWFPIWYDYIAEGKIYKYDFMSSESIYIPYNSKYIVVSNMRAIDYTTKCTVQQLREKMSADGKLLIMVNNRHGVGSLCGGFFDNGIDVRLLCSCLANLGLKTKIYSVFPNNEEPQLIFADNYLPNEKMANRYIPKYSDISKIYIQENSLCDELIESGTIHKYSNSYIVECSANGQFSEITSATLSLDRGRERAIITRTYPNRVEKYSAYEEGFAKIKQLYDTLVYLRNRGIAIVDCELDGSILRMPFVNYMLANNYLQKLAVEDAGLFIQRLDEFYELIKSSSDIIDENELGPILDYGFLDMVPLNCFWDGEKYIVFDQEYVDRNVPVNLMMLRTLIILYDAIDVSKALVPRDSLFDKYGITCCLGRLLELERAFINGIKADEKTLAYYKEHTILPDQIAENYDRLVRKAKKESANNMDRAIRELLIEEYKKNCFNDISGKCLYVFGSGQWADMFMNFYKDEYDIAAVVDSAEEKHGTIFYGYPVVPINVLQNDKRDFKVIICVKECATIIDQLVSMGITNIGVFDAHFIYPGRQGIVVEQIPSLPKKYHVGYVSGVFDLYHIGHINMFRRAKEQCDYLIVAVTSDEYVRNKKNREPYIPVEERVECVKSCRYVDEVFVTPYKYAGIVEAFQKFHYDVQFCGSDYVDNPWWLQQKDWLEEHGSHLEFLSYTEQTSSTKIKGLIDKGLL